MRRRCQKVEHDLEADVGKIGQGFLKRLTAHGEKAAHGIADLRADHLLAEPRRRARQRFPLLIPVAGRSLPRIARADDKIGFPSSSGDRRVGKEGVRTVSSRWVTRPKKQTNTTT